MKKLLLLSFLVAYNFGYSQLFVSNGEEVTVLSNTLVYTNEDVNNTGTITFAESDFIVDAGLDNRNGVINYNDVTLFIGGGSTRSSSNDEFYFKPENFSTQQNTGERVRFVVLDKAGGRVDVMEGHLSILDHFTSTDGILKADGTSGGVMTLINRNNTKVAQVLESTGGQPYLEAERYFPANRAWRFLTPSTTSTTETINDNWQEGGVDDFNASQFENPVPGFGTHITGNNDPSKGFDVNSAGNPSMLTLDNPSQAWQSLPNTNASYFSAGTPYMILVRGDRTIDLEINDYGTETETILRDRGELNIGDYVVTGLSTSTGDFNFIGNPYHSQTDMSEVLSDATDIDSNVYYIWDPNVSGNGGYVTVDLSDGSNNPSGSDANEFLQPKQAAMVITNGTNPQLTFKESHKKADDSDPTSTFSVPSNINIKLHPASDYEPYGLALDGIRINFGDNFSDEVEDDYLHPINPDETLSVDQSSTQYSIVYRTFPEVDESIQLRLVHYNHTDYIFEVNFVENFENEVFIHDNYTDEYIAIDDVHVEHPFSVDENIPESISPHRFEVVFGQNTLGVNDYENSQLSVYPNPAKDNFTITGSSLTGKAEVKIYNMLGQEVYQEMFENAQNELNVNGLNLVSGLYLVKVKSNEKAQTIKLNIR